MKIFVMPSVFPNARNKVAGSFVLKQCQILKSQGHDVLVLDATSFGMSEWLDRNCSNIESYNIDGVDVISLHFRGFALHRVPRLTAKHYEQKLKILFDYAIKNHGKPDLLYAHFSFTSGFVACKLGKAYGISTIVQEHASLILKTQNKHILNMLNYAVKHADIFCAVSPHLKKAIEEKTNTAKPIALLNNPLPQYFHFEPLEKKEKFVFFSAANLIESKGFDVLIEAFALAFGKRQDIELRIAGAGKLEKKLKKLAQKSDANIVFLGALDNENMLKEYKSCNAFALGSRVETFGIVYREALSVGRPVVCVKNDGIAYQWHDDYGILCDDSATSLAKGLKKMHSDYGHYCLEAISAQVLKDFSQDSFYKQFCALLTTI